MVYSLNKITQSNNFLKKSEKNQEEKKAMNQKHSQEPSKTKSPELKRLDPGSKMYDKYNCEFIRDLAEYFETNHELNRTDLIIKFSMFCPRSSPECSLILPSFISLVKPFFCDFIHFLLKNALFKKIVALSNLIQRIYHNDIRNMLP